MIPYVASDPHFKHKKIVEHCHRPANHEELIYNGYKTVGKGNLLICLGDVSMGQEEEVANEYIIPLECRKVLVLGNHDHKNWSWYMNHGWDFVCEQFKMVYAGKVILFSHKPQPWDGDWEVNIHGHLHNLPQLSHHKKEYKELQQWHKLYAPELRDYKPVRLDTFIQAGVKQEETLAEKVAKIFKKEKAKRDEPLEVNRNIKFPPADGERKYC